MTEAFTLVFIWSLILFGLLQTNLVGPRLREAAKPLMYLLSIPGLLVVVGLVVENFYPYEDAQ